MMLQKIISIYFKTTFRIKPRYQTLLDSWLKSKNITFNQDFLAALLMIPFALWIMFGLARETGIFHPQYGIHLVIIFIGFLSLNLIIDLSAKKQIITAQLNKGLKILPLSLKNKILILFTIEAIGFKIYTLFCVIGLFIYFNSLALLENQILYYKIVIIFLLLYLISCSSGMLINALGSNQIKKSTRDKIILISKLFIFVFFVLIYQLGLETVTSLGSLNRTVILFIENNFIESCGALIFCTLLSISFVFFKLKHKHI